MKEKIIKQMTEIVRDHMKSFTDDFYKYDMEALKDYDERFIWQVAPSHTHLSKIGESYLMKMADSEEGIYSLCQRTQTPDAVLNYLWGEDELVFYYDGEMLNQITLMEAQRIWETVRSWVLFAWQQKNGKELPNNFKIPVHFVMCGKIIKSFLKDPVKSANLLSELKRRRNGSKVNHTDMVNVYVESQDSLYFERGYTINGEYRRSLNGGIIYYNGAWHTHT